MTLQKILLKLTLKFVCKIFTKYRVNTQPEHPHTRAARFYAIIAFRTDPHAPAQKTRLSRLHVLPIAFFVKKL